MNNDTNVLYLASVYVTGKIFACDLCGNEKEHSKLPVNIVIGIYNLMSKVDDYSTLHFSIQV